MVDVTLTGHAPVTVVVQWPYEGSNMLYRRAVYPCRRKASQHPVYLGLHQVLVLLLWELSIASTNFPCSACHLVLVAVIGLSHGVLLQ